MQKHMLASWSWASCPRPVSKTRPRLTHGLQSSPAAQHTHPGNCRIHNMLLASCWPETRTAVPGVGQLSLAPGIARNFSWLSLTVAVSLCGCLCFDWLHLAGWGFRWLLVRGSSNLATCIGVGQQVLSCVVQWDDYFNSFCLERLRKRAQRKLPQVFCYMPDFSRRALAFGR